MSSELTYFEAFLKNPASLSNREAHEKVIKWIEFIKANPDKYELLGKGWVKARKRVEADYHRRDRIAAEYEKLAALREQAIKDDDGAAQVKLNQRELELMKKYRLEYEFTDEEIAEAEADFAQFAKSVEDERIAGENAKLAAANVEKSIDDFAKVVFKVSDKIGKPIVLTAHRTPKRNRGN